MKLPLCGLAFALCSSLLVAQTSTTAPTAPCTGLCLQQVQCPAGSTTSISGVVYAPNGNDPIPNVTVYIPNAPVDAMAAGISCPVPGALPSGSPLVGTFSATDGTFTIGNVPVGQNIPLVIVAGKWRRQITIPATAACTNTAVTGLRFPRNQTEGDIPKFAVSTGNADQVECVLRKVGIDDAEFTNPSGNGRINVFQASGAGGAVIDTTTPSASTLMGNSSALSSYDVLMLPCEGNAYNEPADQLANLVSYANAGGRVYASHFAYEWMYHNAPFDTVAQWKGSSSSLQDGPATVNQNFGSGATLAQWLVDVGASTTLGQIEVQTTKADITGVNPPTQTWLTLNSTGNVMQFTFATPVGQATNQCGRVLFNEYHVENTGSSKNKIFPVECTSAAAMTPQEKLLEYSLFDLSNNGGPATMSPASADFGKEAVGFTTASQAFTITNNSVFTSTLTSATASGDFIVTGNSCSSVPAGSTCTVNVAFKPTDLGARTGNLTVIFAGTNLTATPTGTGVPSVALSASTIDFGSSDVGAPVTRTVMVTNNAPGPIDQPSFAVTGDYTATTTCPLSIPSGTSCAVTLTFVPTLTGARPGILSAGTQAATSLTGNGVDFAINLSPASDTVVAGLTKTPVLTSSPLAGFNAPVTITCSINAPASSCTLTNASFTLSGSTPTQITIKTTSQYTLVGYGATSLLAGFGTVLSGMLLLVVRRRSRGLQGAVLRLLLLAVLCTGMTGCSGKLPSLNSSYTPAGNYTVTLSATDGFLTHTATYALTVKAN